VRDELGVEGADFTIERQRTRRDGRSASTTAANLFAWCRPLRLMSRTNSPSRIATMRQPSYFSSKTQTVAVERFAYERRLHR